MLLFISGMFLGAFIVLFVMGLIAASDEDDERHDKCRGCIYQLYDDGSHNCAVCHEMGEM